ncbi:hypothetical protein GCM10009000_077330 [Halobacterium noricense]|uniref:Transposase n=1 Tax=Haladaptatus pallidirubidus TaxID=1008152 RepID=A0AAV3UPP5_9EURY
MIDKPLRKLEDYLNEMPGILNVFDLEESPDYTSFSKWDGEFSDADVAPPAPRICGAGGVFGNSLDRRKRVPA